MTIGAPDTDANVALWSPDRKAYLCGNGLFARQEASALRLTRDQAERVRPTIMERLWIKPVSPEPAHRRHMRGTSRIEAALANAEAEAAANVNRQQLGDVAEMELLRRAVLGLRDTDRPLAPRWALVMDTLGLTSGAAVMLCRRLNIDPNQRTGH